MIEREDTRHMEDNMESININGVEYVPKGSAFDVDSSEWSIVRCDRSGVFMARVMEEEESGYRLPQAKLADARRIWYWDGAASLSELAMRGVSRPENCKFPCPVPEIVVTDVIEIIPMTEEAIESITAVAEWTEHE